MDFRAFHILFSVCEVASLGSKDSVPPDELVDVGTPLEKGGAEGTPDFSGLPETQRKAIARLEQRGWSKMVWTDGYTLLHWAAKQGREDVCAYFPPPQPSKREHH